MLPLLTRTFCGCYHQRIRGGLDGANVQTFPERLTHLGLCLLVSHLVQSTVHVVPSQKSPTSIGSGHLRFLAPLGHEARGLEVVHQRPKLPIAHLRVCSTTLSAQDVVLGHERGALQGGHVGGFSDRSRGGIGDVEVDLRGRLGRRVDRGRHRRPLGGMSLSSPDPRVLSSSS